MFGLPLSRKQPDDISSDDGEAKEHLLPDPAHNQRWRSKSYPLLIWIIATFFLALLSTILSITLLYTTSRIKFLGTPQIGSFELGFHTEIQNAFPEIELETIQFTGGLRYDEDGKLYRNIDASKPQYVGLPSDEMDNAWNYLVNGRYVHFGEEYEGPGLDLALSHPPDNVVEIGVDVLHALHCLNRIRKTLDIDYYRDFLANERDNNRLHVDHCIDYIRQMLQCKADLTPLPVYWTENASRVLPDFDRTHTCRNFGKIRKWAYSHDERIKKQYPQSINS